MLNDNDGPQIVHNHDELHFRHLPLEEAVANIVSGGQDFGLIYANLIGVQDVTLHENLRRSVTQVVSLHFVKSTRTGDSEIDNILVRLTCVSPPVCQVDSGDLESTRQQVGQIDLRVFPLGEVDYGGRQGEGGITLVTLTSGVTASFPGNILGLRWG